MFETIQAPIYCASVRSILKYGSPIWCQYSKPDIDFIEYGKISFFIFSAHESNITFNTHGYLQCRSSLNIQTQAYSRVIQ